MNLSFLARFRSKVAPADRVPAGQKLAYGLGGQVEGMAIWIPKSNLIPVFNIGLGLDPVFISAIMMIWRMWDAITDPVMGNISDNARTRWGRRRPFIVAGAILTGLTLPLMWWMPRDLGQWQMAAWLLVSGFIFYTCFTVWTMPYYSLQLEMSPDYDERTNITAWRAVSQKFITLAGGWILALAVLPVFSTSADGAPDMVNGMRWISIGLGVLTILVGSLPGIFVKERYYAKKTAKQEKQPLIAGMRQTLRTRPFLWLLVVVISKSFGVALVSSLGFYVNAYHVCRGDLVLAAKIQGVKSSLLLVPAILAVPFCTWLSARLGKHMMLYLTTGCGMLGYLSVYVFYTPEHPWLQVLSSLLIGPVSVGLWLVAPSMQADIADYDELATGKRREGSFASVFSWCLKTSGAITTGLAGVVLTLTGFKAEYGAAQPGHVAENLRHFYVCIPVAFMLLNLFAISRYKLTKTRMAEIRTELETRRGKL
ncbi:MFS transporter [Geminisphaera colitermitum]|uniref:MFS transporter n=1 Tax=Geminisphaera colitermitum TaxID=1148786 RepID=UPI0001964EF3|nr:MFS transporter [Geminisphaera colitermitum]